MTRLGASIMGFLWFTCATAQALVVEIHQTDSGYFLSRAGKPYYIKGAGGSSHLDELKKIGGNSVRIWSAQQAEEVLNSAHDKGLSVMLGLWVAHERHGFDYDDKVAVAAQLQKFKGIVQRYKDHPALLLWGVGNEVDLAYSNPKVWEAIQDIAAMIHNLDGQHPTTTVTAGIDSSEVAYIMEKAPDIDILSINTYGDIKRVPKQVKQYGWTGPYMITEWGPDGHWEVDTTVWGAPLEQNSTEKARVYRQRYLNYIDQQPDQLGAYVFLWGQKQETTSTWYGLFTEYGAPTEVVLALQELWGGSGFSNSAGIKSFVLASAKAKDNLILSPDTLVRAEVQVLHPQANLQYRWELKPESQVVSAGGDHEHPLPLLNLQLPPKPGPSLQIRTPSAPGAYRLFVFVENSAGLVSYANFPFLVTPQDHSSP